MRRDTRPGRRRARAATNSARESRPVGGTSSPRLVIVGGGVAGLSAACAALARWPGLDVVVLEREARVGGLVETERTRDGYVIEYGADCLITAKPAGIQAVQELGLEDSLASAERVAQRSFVLRRGELVPLPRGLAFGTPADPLELLRSPLLSATAKLRLACEPLIKPRERTDADESVASFITRRFGPQLLQRVVTPVLEGIHGGAVERMSVSACLPRLRELEQQRGSVVQGMRAARSQSAAENPGVHTLRAGMGSLVDALARRLAGRIRTGTSVTQIERGAGGRYRIHTRDASVLEADALIVAAPAHAASRLVETLSPELARLLDGIRHSRMDSVTLAWARDDVPHALEGSGFVVPRAEGKAIRACTFSSLKWSHRAPPGFVLMRAMLWGEGQSDSELAAAARSELEDLLGVKSAPSLLRVRRKTHVLPLPELGCLTLRTKIAEQAQALGGFALAGSAHGAVGIPDCIESGSRAAALALAQLDSR